MKEGAIVRLRQVQGIALLEVLLSGFILATGILAVLNMQALALGTTQTSRSLLQAEWLLNDLLERMKANPAGYAAALTSWPDGRRTEHCESLTGCSLAELAAHDLAHWYQHLSERLPDAYGEIASVTVAGFPSDTGFYRVSLNWRSVDHGDSSAMPPVSSGIVVLP